VALGSMPMIYLPFLVLTQSQNLHMIQRILFRPPMTALRDNQQCYAKGSYGIHTTSLYLSLSLWCHYFLVAWTGCPDTVHVFSFLSSVGWGVPFLDFVVVMYLNRSTNIITTNIEYTIDP
jgi:hypothetical protein